MTKTISMAGGAGRIVGTTIRGLLWINAQIDWAEACAVALHGLQVLIVLALLAGRMTRHWWDALPGLSERLGCWYAGLVASAPPVPVVRISPGVHPLAELGEQLEQLSCRELRELAGVRRKLSKRELVALLVAA